MPFRMKESAQNKLGELLRQYDLANELRKHSGIRSEDFIGIIEDMRDIEKEMFHIILREDIFYEVPKCIDTCWCKSIPKKSHDKEQNDNLG